MLMERSLNGLSLESPRRVYHRTAKLTPMVLNVQHRAATPRSTRYPSPEVALMVAMEVTVSALPGATPAAIVVGNNAAPSVFADAAPIGGADASSLLALLNGGSQSIL